MILAWAHWSVSSMMCPSCNNISAFFLNKELLIETSWRKDNSNLWKPIRCAAVSLTHLTLLFISVIRFWLNMLSVVYDALYSIAHRSSLLIGSQDSLFDIGHVFCRVIVSVMLVSTPIGSQESCNSFLYFNYKKLTRVKHFFISFKILQEHI